MSSKVYRQLEFVAIGNWHTYEHTLRVNNNVQDLKVSQPAVDQHGALHKIPGSREDVFADQSIDLRSARSLMKFLKLATDEGTHDETLSRWGSSTFPEYLTSEFKIPAKLQSPLVALTLSPASPSRTLTGFALPRIHRHLTSIGMFGPGFGAVIPKWGGLAEVAQVACRASAVGGGVYILNQGIKNIGAAAPQAKTDTSTSDEHVPANNIAVDLDDGTKIRTRFVVGTSDHLPLDPERPPREINLVQRCIAIISSPLADLFPPPVEGCPPLDGAVVVIPADSLPDQKPHPPIYLLVNASGTGQCPVGQCTFLLISIEPRS